MERLVTRVCSSVMFLLIGSLRTGGVEAGLNQPSSDHQYFKCRFLITRSPGQHDPRRDPRGGWGEDR